MKENIAVIEKEKELAELQEVLVGFQKVQPYVKGDDKLFDAFSVLHSFLCDERYKLVLEWYDMFRSEE